MKREAEEAAEAAENGTCHLNSSEAVRSTVAERMLRTESFVLTPELA
jgi:hypothetical protein